MQQKSARQELAIFQTLTDRQLVTTLTTITSFERSRIARVVAVLAEFDARKLYLPLGYTSLFAYCTTKLGFSSDEAFHRIKAARAVRRFPVALDYLESGAINLTHFRLLIPHLTPDNHEALLRTASHQKMPAVELMIARLKPKPDVPSTIRKLPAVPTGISLSVNGAPMSPPQLAISPVTPAAASPIAAPMVLTVAATAARATEVRASESAERMSSSAVPALPGNGAAGPEICHAGFAFEQIPSRRPIIQPLSDVSYRLQITLSKHSHDTLREIQGLIRHIIPTGDPAAIVARSLDLLLADLKRRKAGCVTRPRAPRAQHPRGRHIPDRVKREVWKRDDGRCGFVSPDGMRCDADGFVEFHHVKPYARGGRATVENIELRCRAHNAYEAEVAGLPQRRR